MMENNFDYIIVEDEKLSAKRLAAMVQKILPNSRLLAILDSVSSTVRWLQQNDHPQLAFFDIQLADGLSFEIFEQCNIEFSIVFTTAFNEYALKAFKVNSIDYLLKPINEEELQSAIGKFVKGAMSTPQSLSSDAIANALKMLTNNYKSRFLVKVGEHLRMIPIEEVSVFYSESKATFLKTSSNRNYAIDYTLEQVSSMIDPLTFFRVSRKYLISLASISDIIAYSGSRLKLKLTVPTDDDVLVSREKVNDFKAWLDR